MFANTGGGAKKQQQQLQNLTNTTFRHNNPYQHSLPQQPHYEHHQGAYAYYTYPLCNVPSANTVGNTVGVAGGVQAGHVLYQPTHQPPSQHLQRQVGLHSAEQNFHYFTKNGPLQADHPHHAPQQHNQIRNMITAVSHQRQPFVVSPNYFAILPQQTHASLITNSTPQHAVTVVNSASMATQHQNTTVRSVAPSGPTSYVASPYCTPPLILGGSPTTVTPQAAGIGQAQNMEAYARLSSGLLTASPSSTSINMQTVGVGIGSLSNSEHNTKPRMHAIPIIHPDTMKIVPIEHLLNNQRKLQAPSQPQIKSELNIEAVVQKHEVNVESISIQTEKDMALAASETVNMQTENENSTNSEAVSIKTDKYVIFYSASIQTENDNSLTASIASNLSDVGLPTHSQSISATDTNKVDHQMQNENNHDIGGQISCSDQGLRIPAVHVSNANNISQSNHSDSEPLKLGVYEDSNDTDADTYDQELDIDDSLAIANQPLSETNIETKMSENFIKYQHSNNISVADLVINETIELNSDHFTEAEVKPREPCTTSEHGSLERTDEVKCEENQQDLQLSVSSGSILNESKTVRKYRKAAKRKEKNQKKLKQQQNKSSNLNELSAQNEIKNPAISFKNTETNTKTEDLKNFARVNKAKKEPKLTLIRYSLEELKAFSKSSESRKTPVVPCQKGDCISHLFVSRQQYHHNNIAHHVGQNLTANNLQHHVKPPYHQMNFNESLELINSKRRAGSNENTNIAMPTASINSDDNAIQMQKKMQVIRINLSLNENIKLSKCENAWQPKFLTNNTNSNTPLAKSSIYEGNNIEVVLKKVRGILNKLTSENFNVLLKEMTGIKIDSEEKMREIMLLIFEKTVSEPNFAPTYAKFSKVLFKEVTSKKVFETLLINRLQTEFESNVNNADAKERKLQQITKKIGETTDPQKKIELQAELEHQEYQFRRRAWGTVRFIGEMYKLRSLPANRVLLCVESLLDNGSEEKLEYMCKLLTTVGHLLENSDTQSLNNNSRMNNVFAKIIAIVKKATESAYKKTKVCSRVRFLMQDLIDLRSRNWNQSSSSGHIALRRITHEDKKSDLPSGTINTYEKDSSKRMFLENNNRHNQIRAKEVMQKSSKLQISTQREQHTIDPKKLNFSRGDESTHATTKLGNSCIYMWSAGGDRQTQQSCHITPSSSLLTTSHQYQQKHIPLHQDHTQSQYLSAKHFNSNSDADIKEILKCCSSKDNQKLLNHLLEEYIDCLPSCSKRWQEEVLNAWQNTSIQKQICLVYYVLMDYLHLAATKFLDRNACANIFIYLMNSNALNKITFIRAYDKFAEEFTDLLMDVPNCCTYLFEFVGPLLDERLITFSDIWCKNWRSDQLFTERFVTAFVVYFIKEFGANYMRDLWHKEFKLDQGQEFISDPHKWRDFVSAYNLQFLYDFKLKPEIRSTYANSNHSEVVDQHVQRLKVILSSPKNLNLALDYINTNVNINSYFLKNLIQFLCCDYATTADTSTMMAITSLSGASSTMTIKHGSTCNNSIELSNNTNNTKHSRLNINAFRKNCVPILRLCLDANEDNELICLDSLVDDIQQHYDNKTANDSICEIFDALYDCEVVSKESLEKWYKQRHREHDRNYINSKNQLQRTLSAHLDAYLQKLL